MARRTTKIIIETERIVITGATPRLVWCERCNHSAFEVSLQQAALITQTRLAGLQQALEAGHLHHSGEIDGKLLFCLSSLTKASS